MLKDACKADRSRQELIRREKECLEFSRSENATQLAEGHLSVELMFHLTAARFVFLDTHVGGSGAVHASRLPLALAGFCRGPPAAPFSDRVWGCEAKPFAYRTAVDCAL